MTTTVAQPIYHSPDFRTYPPETFDDNGGTITMKLCEELVDGRWEPFYSIVERSAHA
jgi:hypothetical protein